MEIRKFLIAGGNPTLLVWGCPLYERDTFVLSALNEEGIEQVGFVTQTDEGIPELTMMGGELCVDATLALASLSGSEGYLRTSGVAGALQYTNGATVTVSFSLPHTREGDVIIFDGIGYLCTTDSRGRSKEELREYADRYRVPAFGSIVYSEQGIVPTVYVVKTDSFFVESACGSGSIATHLVTNASEITQPTGEKIVIEKRGEHFLVTASVVEVG